MTDERFFVKAFMLWDPANDTCVRNWDWRGDFKTNKTIQARFAWQLGLG